jgi:Na+-driven multidrug efflux pump
VVSMCILVSLTQTFTSRNRQQVNIVAGVIALVGNILLNLVLIPKYGIVGAAVASLISYTIAAGILIIFFVQQSHLSVFDLLLPKREDFRYFWNLAGRGINKVLAARQSAAVVASERG